MSPGTHGPCQPCSSHIPEGARLAPKQDGIARGGRLTAGLAAHGCWAGPCATAEQWLHPPQGCQAKRAHLAPAVTAAPPPSTPAKARAVPNIKDTAVGLWGCPEGAPLQRPGVPSPPPQQHWPHVLPSYSQQPPWLHQRNTAKFTYSQKN